MQTFSQRVNHLAHKLEIYFEHDLSVPNKYKPESKKYASFQEVARDLLTDSSAAIVYRKDILALLQQESDEWKRSLLNKSGSSPTKAYLQKYHLAGASHPLFLWKEKPKFKIGDLVRVKNGTWDAFRILTINDIGNIFGLPGWPDAGWGPEQLELVQDVEKSKAEIAPGTTVWNKSEGLGPFVVIAPTLTEVGVKIKEVSNSGIKRFLHGSQRVDAWLVRDNHQEDHVFPAADLTTEEPKNKPSKVSSFISALYNFLPTKKTA